MFILPIVPKQNTCIELDKTKNVIEVKGDKHKLFFIVKFKHAAE